MVMVNDSDGDSNNDTNNNDTENPVMQSGGIS